MEDSEAKKGRREWTNWPGHFCSSEEPRPLAAGEPAQWKALRADCSQRFRAGLSCAAPNAVDFEVG